jgi:DMSO/TMAO reductase YedYZ molybdopterin-dependent catalytic subunit
MFAKLMVCGGLLLTLVMVGCGDSAGSAGTTEAAVASPAADGTTTTTTTTLTAGQLEPIVVPTLPDVIPGYTEVDPATGLHMTGTPTAIDLAGYRLKVTGMVVRELSLSYDDLRRLPKVTATPRLVCPGVFEDTTTWSGVPLEAVLELAGVQSSATEIKMNAADGYGVFLDLNRALKPENFLAYEWMDQPLPVLHGFPLRAVLPEEYGSLWVKWLLEIVVK